MPLAVVHHPGYTIDLPAGHPFPMGKFSVLRALLDGGPFEFFEAPEASRAALDRVHAAGYLDALETQTLSAEAQRRMGFAWTPALWRRTRLGAGGTLRAVELALARGLACNAAGGTHHAFRDFASGYCILNDLAAASLHARALGVGRVLIVDCDVHQGDGTASILADEPEVFTFSIHCEKNFPHRKQTSDLDVGLPVGTGDEGYLAALADSLPWLLDHFQPELVLYDAGVDVHADDRLGHLKLSDQGIARRDRYVIEHCRQRGLATACVIGGGYDRDLDRLAARHAILFREASAWA